jgi:acyl carrier protein
MTMSHEDAEPMGDAIIAFIRRRFPGVGDEVDPDTPLLEGQAMDSLGVLELMTFLGASYDIEISDEDFVPENFETVGALVRFVERKRAASTTA